ncbi:hypothetical protein [Microbacterium testaceum]|uniref:hypothetical protein n=1 Tax=Microbacterium testaceum TaxID=2033 RepID=UPI000CD2F957|nr:hypothetical protein [Microbacterium testaceum]
MPIASKPIKWVKRAAKDLRPGDCDKFGYGHGMENSFRTISRVEMTGRGIVRVWHRETLDSLFDEYGENHTVEVASEPAIDERATRQQQE